MPIVLVVFVQQEIQIMVTQAQRLFEAPSIGYLLLSVDPELEITAVFPPEAFKP